MGIRVYELAKKLGLPSKKILEIAEKNNIKVTKALSSLDTDQEELILQKLSEEKIDLTQSNQEIETSSQESIYQENIEFQDKESTEEKTDMAVSNETDQVEPMNGVSIAEVKEAPKETSHDEKLMDKKLINEDLKNEELMEEQSIEETAIDADLVEDTEIKNILPADNNKFQEPEFKKTYQKIDKKEEFKKEEFKKEEFKKEEFKKGFYKERTKKEENHQQYQQKKREDVRREDGKKDFQKKREGGYGKTFFRKDEEGSGSKERRGDIRRKPKDFKRQVFPKKQQPLPPPQVIIKERKKIEISIPITLKDLSQILGIKANLIIQKLLTTYKRMVRLNQNLDQEMVEEVALSFDREIVIKKDQNLEENLLQKFAEQDAPENLVPRAPVVTLMGHVDHGKTSLLDRIRRTNVASTEAGNITQHIGAYKVNTDDGKSIVFLDTPGHEAFTAMRARGANITDIVVLVVASDDGVMPQTVEAINHAKAAGVPIVVALNKIDKPESKVEITMQQLSSHNLIPEEWGGETGFIKVSALSGEGISQLLEYISLVAEMEELKANPNRPAYGTVVEAKVDSGKGMLATLLVKNGTLKNGDFILCGNTYGRVRAMLSDTGVELKEAGPSTPVEVLGLNNLPEPGDGFYVVDNPTQAVDIAKDRQSQTRQKTLAAGGTGKFSAEEMLRRFKEGEVQEVQVILKTDVQGSLEAIRYKIGQYATEEVKVRINHAAVGAINESDVQLADATGAIILGFNVAVEKNARDMAEERKIKIFRYNIIYHLLEELRKMMEDRLIPEEKEEVLGHAVIRKIIKASRLGNIAGCFVTDGVIERSSKLRLSRGGVIISKDRALDIGSLRRFKDDVREVKAGFECGIKVENFEDIKEGDEFEAFKVIQIARKLEPLK